MDGTGVDVGILGDSPYLGRDAERSGSFLRPEWKFVSGYEPFRRLGSDTIVTVSSGRQILWTCSTEVISQIVARRHDFPKPTEFYRVLEIYGPNVVSTEGPVWRRHRKITSAPFTEKNSELVWTETLNQVHAMLKSWLQDRGEGTVHEVAEDTMTLTLNIISGAAFGMPLAWPGQSRPSSQANGALSSQKSTNEVSPGHRMTFQDAIETVLTNIVWILLLPHVFLSTFLPSC